jgi:hypothetical protein
VTESAKLKVTGYYISHYEESTGVSLGRDANGLDVSCSVSVSAPGWGGPENKVGEKVPTTVNSRPGFRDGAGAEGPYLMWQQPGKSWTEVTCDGSGDGRLLDVVADAVKFRRSSIKVPFEIGALPSGYGPALIIQDLTDGRTEAYLGVINPAFGHADGDLVVSYESGPEPVRRPSGRPIVVGGRTALLNEEPRSPGLCVFEQQRYVCVWTATSDTGPYPDRSGQIPTLIQIAENLRFANNLDDRSTWFGAERVFGG